MKGLCAECGQDLTQLQNKNGKPQIPISTATVSMVHSVPELMVSSEQAEQLGREDQQRLHRNRKLVLMVDLDQTLIHTTEQHCQQMSNKGIFHFQLGRGEPMLHTRLRPHCKDFLEKIAKLYELHVFTFGSRLYAHTIAGFLDPEKRLFSHRILSRDECIDPFSKTGNLRNLFPCGDSMVCIIDDREDVWKFAPNLITVKKYVYFQGTGDIHAPPGTREAAQLKKKVTANHTKPADVSEPAVLSSKDSEEAKSTLTEEQSNGLRNSTKEQNGSRVSSGDSSKREDHSTDATKQEKCNHESKTASNDLDFCLSSDSESEAEKTSLPPSTSDSESENEERRSWKRSKKPADVEHIQQQDCSTESAENKEGGVNHSKEDVTEPKLEPSDGPSDLGVPADSEQDSLPDLGNGCSDKKEAETESQNSEQSGVTMGESLDQSMEEEDEEDLDEDDHLVYLEEILARVHTSYFAKYDRFLKKEIPEMPDIRKIVPELKGKVFEGVTLVFSGLYPTNYPIERTREYYHATALGAKVRKNLVLNPEDTNRTTHVIAARPGTEKVRQAQGCKHLHVVNPEWLWSSLERWERVEEKLFPLKEDYIKTQRANSPATFPDLPGAFQTPLFHPTPIHPKALSGPEVRIYDPNTGKLIRKGSQSSRQSPYIQPPGPPVKLAVHGEQSSFRVVQPQQQQQMLDEEEMTGQDEEQPGPSRRKRQPSMSETMPLYTLCKEDLESMDKEVDDILGEDSDNDSDTEKGKKVEEEAKKKQKQKNRHTENLGTKTVERLGSSSSEGSLTGSVPRGHKRKLEDDSASESSKESSNEDEEGSSSEADEMAAALEAELNDFM
ncbi:RNA polymerase II subunit A C-terminal domain phosphatase isoform X2 [Latimeria chalumnae]|nr:PREDICTED: RNA polymerase II subunit A C-terminal domain phosphatase isoform X1 [Latimeria chalumnae]|eukprot:XP_006011102.2 PREDICTED: RNA polymerase II subunit A C-terminal domain phosphatase isoform X1 [Latimeria chalumnae]